MAIFHKLCVLVILLAVCAKLSCCFRNVNGAQHVLSRPILGESCSSMSKFRAIYFGRQVAVLRKPQNLKMQGPNEDQSTTSEKSKSFYFSYRISDSGDPLMAIRLLRNQVLLGVSSLLTISSLQSDGTDIPVGFAVGAVPLLLGLAGAVPLCLAGLRISRSAAPDFIDINAATNLFALNLLGGRRNLPLAAAAAAALGLLVGTCEELRFSSRFRRCRHHPVPAPLIAQRFNRRHPRRLGPASAASACPSSRSGSPAPAAATARWPAWRRRPSPSASPTGPSAAVSAKTSSRSPCRPAPLPPLPSLPRHSVSAPDSDQRRTLQLRAACECLRACNCV